MLQTDGRFYNLGWHVEDQACRDEIQWQTGRLWPFELSARNLLRRTLRWHSGFWTTGRNKSFVAATCFVLVPQNLTKRTPEVKTPTVWKHKDIKFISLNLSNEPVTQWPAPTSLQMQQRWFYVAPTGNAHNVLWYTRSLRCVIPWIVAEQKYSLKHWRTFNGILCRVVN